MTKHYKNGRNYLDGGPANSKGLGAIIRKKEDQQAARDAYDISDENPFEVDSRRWKIFERYKENGTTGFTNNRS